MLSYDVIINISPCMVYKEINYQRRQSMNTPGTQKQQRNGAIDYFHSPVIGFQTILQKIRSSF